MNSEARGEMQVERDGEERNRCESRWSMVVGNKGGEVL